MTIHWASFWIGFMAAVIVIVAFFTIYIALAERRVKKLLDEERGRG